MIIALLFFDSNLDVCIVNGTYNKFHSISYQGLYYLSVNMIK